MQILITLVKDVMISLINYLVIAYLEFILHLVRTLLKVLGTGTKLACINGSNEESIILFVHTLQYIRIHIYIAGINQLLYLNYAISQHQ